MRINKKGKLLTLEKYKEAESTNINYFYEKLLLLKDLMNTKMGNNKNTNLGSNFWIDFLKNGTKKING